MDIAIIGSGVSGLVCAHYLSRRHRITLFEADDRIGGHVNTIEVEDDGRRLPVDTGFIVFNDGNYPNFRRLLDELGIAARPTRMSFSVRCERTGLEYGGHSLNGVFAQRANLFRPSFLGMLRDIGRFGREAPAAAARAGPGVTLGSYLDEARYSREFCDQYLVPMAAAIWSSSTRQVRDFPLKFFVSFFANHGMLTPRRAPQWRVVEGGSAAYVRALTAPIADRIRRAKPIRAVRRVLDAVEVTPALGGPERFDHAVIAAHADQALAMLAEPTPAEREVLSAFRYQANSAVLHTDERLLPRSRRAWSAWNGAISAESAPDRPVSVTYNQTILQSLPTSRAYCVTLNDDDRIDARAVIARMTYHHPVITAAGVAAQARHGEISGAGRVHFCGAYWGNGFHEDGVKSGLAVCAALGVTP